MKRFIYLMCLLGLVLTPIFAQELSSEEVLAKLEEGANSMQDASFLLTGKLIDTDGQEFPLEVSVQLVPSENLVRADFIQPDAIADNFIILDKDGVYSYNFLTNQVSIYNLGDAEAFGGLFPSASEGSSYEFTLNMTELFSGWNVTLEGYQEGLYQLRFSNTESEDIILGHVDVSVDQETWLPAHMLFYSPEDNQVAELVFNDLRVNQELDPEEIRSIPDDAEILDER
jgi:outer membrane lipoprotein-sorting protein